MDEVERALEGLYRSRYGKFTGVLTAMTGDRELGRDLVQEAFAIALSRRHQFRGDGSLEGWVWKIAVRLAGRTRPSASAPTASARQELLEIAGSSEVAEALRALAPRRRLFVFLRYFADLSYEEIAAVCGVSRGTVAATLAQARSELRPLIDSPFTAGGVTP